MSPRDDMKKTRSTTEGREKSELRKREKTSRNEHKPLQREKKRAHLSSIQLIHFIFTAVEKNFRWIICWL